MTRDDGAFVTLTLERAREEARAAERAYARGEARPLEGLTLAVKDIFDTAGVETHLRLAIYAGHVPGADAEAVRRARAAGAIVVGKTLTHEFAWGITSVNPHFPPLGNPPTRRASPAARAAARRWRWPRGWPRWRWARTPAARSASRPRSAACPG